jgi:hypothetical protein
MSTTLSAIPGLTRATFRTIIATALLCNTGGAPRFLIGGSRLPRVWVSTTTSTRSPLSTTSPISTVMAWGAIVSLSATGFTNERLFYQLRLNEILAPRSYNTFNAMFGIGYELDGPKTGGSLAGGTSDSVSSGNQITAMAGTTEVNSLRSPGAFAYGFEYRHGFGRYFDGTISWINEGHTQLDTRSGAAAQVWLRRSFFDDKLSLGVGAGPYAFVTDDRYRRYFNGLLILAQRLRDQ